MASATSTTVNRATFRRNTPCLHARSRLTYQLTAPRSAPRPFLQANMDSITYIAHNQSIHLGWAHYVFSRHWAMSLIEGDWPATDANETALCLENLPNRISTVPILHHLLRRPIVAILLITWIFACLRRHVWTRVMSTWLATAMALVYVSGTITLLTYASQDRLDKCIMWLVHIAALSGIQFAWRKVKYALSCLSRSCHWLPACIHFFRVTSSVIA